MTLIIFSPPVINLFFIAMIKAITWVAIFSGETIWGRGKIYLFPSLLNIKTLHFDYISL